MVSESTTVALLLHTSSTIPVVQDGVTFTLSYSIVMFLNVTELSGGYLYIIFLIIYLHLASIEPETFKYINLEYKIKILVAISIFLKDHISNGVIFVNSINLLYRNVEADITCC